jgi:hypothetical protein
MAQGIVATLEADVAAAIEKLIESSLTTAEASLQQMVQTELQALPGIVEKSLEGLPAIIQTEIAKYLPALVQAVVQAAGKTAVQIAVTGEQKLTQMIPGQLDNMILDPIFQSVVADFGHIFGQ